MFQQGGSIHELLGVVLQYSVLQFVGFLFPVLQMAGLYYLVYSSDIINVLCFFCTSSSGSLGSNLSIGYGTFFHNCHMHGFQPLYSGLEVVEDNIVDNMIDPIKETDLEEVG